MEASRPGVSERPLGGERAKIENSSRRGLQRLGWVEGRNVRIDYRFTDGRAERFTPLAKELLALKPELIFAQ
jgi:hypothetical protein